MAKGIHKTGGLSAVGAQIPPLALTPRWCHSRQAPEPRRQGSTRMTVPSESWGAAANLATTPERLLSLLPAGLPFLRASVVSLWARWDPGPVPALGAVWEPRLGNESPTPSCAQVVAQR